MLDLFKKIIDMLKGVDICEKCESSKKTTEKVMNLTPEEMEEWASIRAET